MEKDDFSMKKAFTFDTSVVADPVFSRLNYDANILYLIFARESEK